MALVNPLRPWLHGDEKGQGLAEYALIISLVAIVAIAVLFVLSGNINTVFSTVGKSL
jgi:Flp pilus assembly pilin Flp